MKDYAIISSFINALVSLICCIYLLVENKKNKINANIIYFLSSLSILLWSISYFFWQLSTDAVSALFWCRMLMAGSIFITPTFFHFVVVFLDMKNEQEKMIKFLYGISILFLILDFTSLFVNRVEANAYFQFWPKPGLLYLPFFIIFIFYMIFYSQYLMIKNYSKKDKIIQNQIKYIMLGTLIGIIGGSTNYALWYNIKIPPYGNPLVVLYVLVITYGLTNRLVSIDLASRKLFSYFLVFITIAIPFFIVSFFIKQSILSSILLSCGAVLLTIILSDKLKKFFEPAMLGIKYGYFADIQELGKRYQKETFNTTEELMLSLLSNIKKIINLKHISVFLLSNNDNAFMFFKQLGKEDVSKEKIFTSDELVNALLKYKNYISKEMVQAGSKSESKSKIIDTMNNVKAEVAYPLFVNNKLEGVLFLGAKETNSMFNRNDFKGLNELIKTTEYKLTMTLYNEQQHIIIDIGKGMNEILEFTKLAEYTVRSIQRAMDLSYICIYFFDEKTKQYSCHAQNNLDENKRQHDILDETNYFIRFLMQRQTPIFSHDIFKLSEESKLDDLKIVADITKKLEAEMIIPIICGKPSGFIVLGKKNNKESFNMHDFTNCMIIMTNVSSATQNIVLSDIAVTDELTQIHNRRYLKQMAGEEIAKAINQKKILVAFLIDIDHFKLINDKYKHSKGDFILKKVCEVIESNIRKTDLLVRYGGEEILILKCLDSVKEAEDDANRLRVKIMNNNDLSPFKITVSIGYSILDIDIEKEKYKILNYDSVLIRQLILHGSDKGLYSAKSQGRNKVCFGGGIKLSDVLGKGFVVKAVIVNDNKKVATNQESYFVAANCDVKITNSFNAEALIDEWSPDVILLDARNIENWEILFKNIVSRHSTSIVGLCLASITEELRVKLQEMDITKIFVGEGEALEISSWIRDTKESILS